MTSTNNLLNLESKEYPKIYCPDCKENEIYTYVIWDSFDKRHLIKICYSCGYYKDNRKVLHKQDIIAMMNSPEFKWLSRLLGHEIK